jgi:hypothetical protein
VLEIQDRERLEGEARRREMSPSDLAREYIQAGLAHLPPDAEDPRRGGLAALKAFRELRDGLRREGYPSVDAVEVTRKAREELEERPYL